MRSYRTALIALLALIIGFVAARVTFRCPKPESVALPKPVHTNEVLAWEPPDPRLGSLELVIPNKLCKPSAGEFDELRDEWHVKKVDTKVTCPIKTQPDTTSPITYRYKYNFKKTDQTSTSVTVKASGVANAATEEESSTVQVIDIVGSCDGCDRLTPKGVTDTKKTYFADQEVKCIQNHPVIMGIDGDLATNILVPSDVPRVTWFAQGGEGYPTITAPSTLCSNIGKDPNAQKAWCEIAGEARDGKPHTYSISLSACNNNTPADYTLTPASPLAQPTKPTKYK